MISGLWPLLAEEGSQGAVANKTTEKGKKESFLAWIKFVRLTELTDKVEPLRRSAMT